MANPYGFLADLVDPFDITGQDAAEQARKDNASNLQTQVGLAQNAQDFFKTQSDIGIAGIQGASTDAQYALSGGLTNATAQLNLGRRDAANALGQGQDQSLASLASGYGQGRGDISGGYAQGRSDLAGGYGQARGDLGRLQSLQGYAGNATQAIGSYDVTGAPSRAGAMLDQPGGLYGGFQQDPGYQFRQQQGEQAINRQAAAQGGRGGGATMKALADYNQGLASQEFGNYAARQQAQAGLASGVDAQRAALLQNQAGRSDQAALEAQRNQMSLAGMGYGAQSSLADMASRYGAGQAGMSVAGGQALGGMAYGYGGQRAGVQTQYGQNRADLYQQTANTQAGMTYGTGGAMSNLIYGAGSDAANIGIGVGAQGVNSSQSLMGAYNDAMNNQQAIGQNEQDQKMGLLGAAASIFSDSRLKRDIETMHGSRYERIGLRGVRWTWNTIAHGLGLRGVSEGVIAQEVMEKYPHAVRVRGDWLVVDYEELGRLIMETA